jgi:cholesterol transport system auxiliary component
MREFSMPRSQYSQRRLLMFDWRKGAGAAPAATIWSGWALLAAVILAAGAGSGCSSPRPPKYYELSPPAPVSAASSNSYPISLLVGHLEAPVILRDDRLVYRTGPVEMGTYDDQRWSEPPTDMVEAMLVRTLRDSGRFRSVDYARSHARAQFILRGRLAHLEEVDEGDSIKATVEIDLELFDMSAGDTVWFKTYAHDESVATKTVPAVVEALDRDTQQLVHQACEDILQYFASNPPK